MNLIQEVIIIYRLGLNYPNISDRILSDASIVPVVIFIFMAVVLLLAVFLLLIQ